MTTQQVLRYFQGKKPSSYATLAALVLFILVLPLTVFLAEQPQETRQFAAGTGNDLYISSSGSDSNSCTQSSPCATITHAATLATPGTTVHVAPGIYPQAVTTTVSGTATGRVVFV